MNEPHDLTVRYFDGGLSDEEIRELQAALLSDPMLCKEFVASAEIHGRLMSELAGGEVIRLPQPTHHRGWGGWAMGLAAVLALSFGGWWWSAQPVKPHLEMASAELAIARVIHTEHARWGLDRDREAAMGEWLMPDTYHLQAGAVVFALDIGGTARIEAPAVFELLDAEHIRLESGNLQVRFEEPGQGFTVFTPEGEVIDLGTEFRVEVSGRESKVQVVEGRVRMHTGDATRELGDDEGVSMTAGALTAFTPDAARPMADEFENEHPVVFYHWSFDELEGEGFAARGSVEAEEFALCPGLPGALPERIVGRAGQAVRFSGTDEFLVSAYRGVSDSRPRTVAAWVRIPRDAQPEESYGWAGWGLLAEKGDYSTAQKWQVGWNPQVRLKKWSQPLSPNAVVGSIRTEFGPGWVNGTRDLRDGQWHHLVSIFIGGEDPDVATHIRHYIDGRLEATSGYQRHVVKTDTGDDSLSLLVGHHMTSAMYLIRNASKAPEDRSDWSPYFSGFRGDLDELYIFEGALTPVQVWRLFKENRPPEPDKISPSIGIVGW